MKPKKPEADHCADHCKELARRLAMLYPRPIRRRLGPELTTALEENLRSEQSRNPRTYLATGLLRGLADTLGAWFTVARPQHRPGDRKEYWMSSIWFDVRWATRSLLRRPAFFSSALVLLALGIGANVAIWSVTKAVLLTPLPYTESEQLAIVWSQWTNFDETWISLEEGQLYRDQVPAFEDFAIWSEDSASFDDLDSPLRARALGTSYNLLRVFGREPLLGRSFTAAEGDQEALVIMISAELWRTRYSAAPSLVGSTVGIEGRPYTVVGILPEAIDVPQDLARAQHADVWFPIRFPDGEPMLRHGGGNHGFFGVGRLRPGVQATELQAQLDTHVARLSQQGVYPDTMRFRAIARSAQDEVVGKARPAIVLFLAASGLVLLVAAFNVASLAIAEGLRRGDEHLLRAAIGAGRWRIVASSLLEASILALSGGALGLAAARGALAFITNFAPTDVPRIQAASLDPSSLLVALLLSLASALLFGAWPAIAALRGAPTVANLGRATTGRGARRARSAVAAAQIAVAVVLVVAAGLTARSFAGLLSLDPGFSTRDAFTFRVFLPSAYFPETESVVATYDRILEHLRGEPGIAAVGAARLLPLASTMGDYGVRVEGYEPPPGEHPSAEWQAATPGYFMSLGTPIVEGRDFEERDGIATDPVMIVNRAFVRAYMPGGQALGRRVRIDGRDEAPWTTVIGVVGDIHHNGITTTSKPTWYLPHSQFALSTGWSARSMTIVASTLGDKALAPAARRALDAVDPRLAVGQTQTLRSVLAAQTRVPRFTAFLIGLFAGLALLLAVLGVLSVLTHLVRQRTREIGIRLAMGATPRDAARLVFQQGGRLIAVGVVAGGLIGVVASPALRQLLYGIAPLDPSTFTVTIVAVTGAALAACYLPARSASRVDPARVLHTDA